MMHGAPARVLAQHLGRYLRFKGSPLGDRPRSSICRHQCLSRQVTSRHARPVLGQRTTVVIETNSMFAATRVTRGASSCNNSSHLPASVYSNWVNPVTCPPGHAMFSTKPDPTGSITCTNTIG